jgi:carbon-monoxide dehydrogenase medium subunit
MKPPPFAYEAPATMEAAIRLLAAAGDRGVALAGGQSLIPLLRYRVVEPELVVDLRNTAGANKIAAENDGRIEISAMVTHAAAGRWASSHGHPMLGDAIAHIGNPAVRNMGTVVGSLAYADPAAEWAAVALALDGTCLVAGPKGKRSVDVQDLFTGPYATNLARDELLVGLKLRAPGIFEGGAFEEIALRPGDMAIAGAAVLVRLDGNGRVGEASVGLIGLAPTPRRSPAVESRLVGFPPGGDIGEVTEAVTFDIEPQSDMHASAEYRQRVAPIVVGRAIGLALERANGSVR